MARRQANPVFQQHAHQNTDTNVMFAKTSQSLGVVLRRARASGFLELSDRRLRALPVEAYAPTPEDLDPDEKFWEIVELRSLDATGNLFEALLVLQSKVNDLNSMLRHQDGALSQAKRFALKKQLARANADKIRFERELASR